MANEIIEKKLDQMKELLSEIRRLTGVPFGVFVKDLTVVRAAERNFQLIVDLASDINIQLLLESGKKTPDTYRQSFTDLGAAGIIDAQLAKKLADSAKIRNILVHEYDFEEDYEKFYSSAKGLLPSYDEYMKVIYTHIKGKK